MYQVAVCICNFMVFSITMSGWPRWPSHLPAMTESLCFRCPHVSLPMWQTKTWPAMRPILILKILLVFMKNVLCAYYLLRLYSSFLIIICMFNFYWIIHHFLILPYITSYKKEKKTFSLCWGLQKKTFSSKKFPFIRFLTISIYMQKLAVVLEARKFNDDFSLC